MQFSRHQYRESIEDSVALTRFLQEALDIHQHVTLSYFQFTAPVLISVNVPNGKLTLDNCTGIDKFKIKDSTLDTLIYDCDFEGTELQISNVKNLSLLKVKNTSRRLKSIHIDNTTDSKIPLKEIYIGNDKIIQSIKISGYQVAKLGLHKHTNTLESIDSEITEEENLFLLTLQTLKCKSVSFLNSINKNGIVLPSVELIDATFNESLDFESCTLKSLRMVGVTFQNSSVFRLVGGEIIGSLDIINFKGSHLYLRSFLRDRAAFAEISDKSLKIEASHCTFAESLIIANCDIRTLGLSGPGSSTNYINKLTIKNLTAGVLKLDHQIIKKETSITSSKISDLNANYATFLDQTSFEDTTFINAPHFFESKLFPDTNFRGSIFKKIDASFEGRFRKLKHHMKNIENDRDEIVFSSLELHSRTKGLRWSNRYEEKILGYLYSATNQYGRSILMPAVWLSILYVVGFFVFQRDNAMAFSSPTTNHPIFDTWFFEIKYMSPQEKAALISFFNSLGPIRLLINLNIFIPKSFGFAVFQWIQLTVSTILWYLFIIGIRRRFRTS